MPGVSLFFFREPQNPIKEITGADPEKGKLSYAGRNRKNEFAWDRKNSRREFLLALRPKNPSPAGSEYLAFWPQGFPKNCFCISPFSSSFEKNRGQTGKTGKLLASFLAV